MEEVPRRTDRNEDGIIQNCGTLLILLIDLVIVVPAVPLGVANNITYIFQETQPSLALTYEYIL